MKLFIEKNADNVDTIFIFVGDFRFGNNYLKENKTFKELFYDGYTHPNKSLISLTNDEIMYQHALKCLDWYVDKYAQKVKFIFWCLNYRETMNKKAKKYMTEDGIYKHPVWNYSTLSSRYNKNMIDVNVMSDRIEEFTLDAQGHPSMKGFSFLYHCFKLKGARHAMHIVDSNYMKIMKQLFQ